MRTIARNFSAAIALLLVMNGAAYSKSLQLSPFKDKLFKYPGVLETGYKGDYVKVAYDKYIDIHKRDIILERKVDYKYVTNIPWGRRAAQRLQLGKFLMKYFTVGKATGRVKFIVVYLHGSGGNRFQGVNDWTFGGNFNRIQNLAYRNGGLFLSPAFEGFGDKGAAQISRLINYHVSSSPNAPVFVACGSKAGFLCWRLTRDPAVLPKMGGMLLLGSTWDNAFLKSAAYKRKLPIYFGHGTWDNVLPWQKQFSFFENIKKKSPRYPAKFSLFNTGTHGTPIRMTDWRLILNWMLSLRG